MATLYRIRNWNKLYENSESKKIKNTRYVLIPNHHDGKGYRRLLELPEVLPEHPDDLRAHPDGVRVFSAWILILQIASKCAERGVLADEDGPLTAEDMAYKTGAPQDLFASALRVLSGKDFRWIEEIGVPEHPDDLPEHPDEPGDHPDRTELNRTELNRTNYKELAREKSKQPAPPPTPAQDHSHCQLFESGMGSTAVEVCALWARMRSAAGLSAVEDANTRRGAEILALEIDGGRITLEQAELAIRNLMENAEARSKYGLRGLANNLALWIDGGPKEGGSDRVRGNRREVTESGSGKKFAAKFGK